jgi:hypothetical protein
MHRVILRNIDLFDIFQLKDQLIRDGLVINEDFEWAYHPEDYTVNFTFYGEAESFASLFALKWLPT